MNFSKEQKNIYSIKLSKYILLLLIASFVSFNVLSQGTKIRLIINNQSQLTASLVDNSSTIALIELLNDGPITIEMHDYANMEKVGSIGTSLPRNDEQITTEPGDIILYQGSALVIYYAPNSWNFTRLGKIDNITQDELKTILGDGDITVTLELEDNATSTVLPDANKNQFLVYPNPANDYVEVSGPFEIITLLDITGKKIYATQNNRVQINDLKPGTYFLRIESKDKKAVVRKFVKQ